MIKGEREAARAEREVASATAKAERDAAATDQRRPMEEVFELRLQLVPWARQSERALQSGTTAGGAGTANFGCVTLGPTLKVQYPARSVAEGELRATGPRGESDIPTKGALQGCAVAMSGCVSCLNGT